MENSFWNEREVTLQSILSIEEKDEQKVMLIQILIWVNFCKKFKIKHQELDNSEKSIEVQNKIFPAKTSYSSLKK